MLEQRGRDLYNAYVQWLIDTPEAQRFPRKSDTPQAVLPDAVAHESLDLMRAMEDTYPGLREAVLVRLAVEREFSRGLRCSVCANADDPDYDHGRNC